MSDGVNHPKHYNDHPTGVECVRIIEHFPANVAFAVKHLWRAGLKPGESAEKDLRKALNYVQFEIDRLTRDNQAL